MCVTLTRELQTTVRVNSARRLGKPVHLRIAARSDGIHTGCEVVSHARIETYPIVA